MPFHDLNVPYTSDSADLSQTLLFLSELGYSTVAVSLHITGKIPQEPPAVPLPSINSSKPLCLLTRLTITISDPSQNHRLSSLQQHYDLVALRPTTEKTLALCCTSLECDLISLDFSQRLFFLLKFKTISAALQRGIRFEICYSPGINGGSDARRNLISGATALIRATRGGRGVVLSGEAKTALGCRGPWDVINLAVVWGLGQERGKESVCEEPGKVVRLAGLKRTSFRGVVDIIQGDTELEGEKAQRGQEQAAIKEKQVVVANGTKRKASAASTNFIQTQKNAEEKPVSKRETKRRAKKPRTEGKEAPETERPKEKPNGFAIKHEALSKGKG